MNDEHLNPETENTPPDADDLRYASQPEESEAAPVEAHDPLDEILTEAAHVEDSEAFSVLDIAELAEAEAASEFGADSLDIDAALAAVSTLDDLIAEQEAAAAAQQAAEEEAARLAAEREARMRHPESFFPMPALSSLPRGRLDSVISAVVLIVMGGVLTLALTGGAEGLLIQPAFVIPAVILFMVLARWVVNQPKNLGNLLFALGMVLLVGFGSQYLTPLGAHWPLFVAGVGALIFLRNLLNGPRNAMRLYAPLSLTVAGVAGWLVTSGQLPAELQPITQGALPVVLGAVAVLLLLPVLFKQRN